MKVIYRRIDLTYDIGVKIQSDVRFRLSDYTAYIFSSLNEPGIASVMYITGLSARYPADVVSDMLISDR